MQILILLFKTADSLAAKDLCNSFCLI